MNSQLTLIDIDEDIWTLDEHTCRAGRRGIAEAREALRLAAASSGREPAHSRRHNPSGSGAGDPRSGARDAA